MKTYTFRLTTIIATLLMMLWGCSKERFDAIKKDEVIPPPVVKVEVFPTVDEQAKKSPIFPVESTKKKINNDAEFSFSSTKGTSIQAKASDFMFANGLEANYPIDLEILELYSPMDMILNRKSTVSNGQMLITGGQVNIKASKDGKPLSLTINSSFSVSIPSKRNVDNDMKVFYGNELENGTINWNMAKMQEQFIGKRDSTKTGLYFGQTKYEIFPSQINWINIDKFYSYQGETTKINFTSTNPSIESINIFLYFDVLNSVMEVYDVQKPTFPVGEYVKLVCFAQTNENNLYTFYKNFNIGANQAIEIKLEKTTKEDFLKYLQGL